MWLPTTDWKASSDVHESGFDLVHLRGLLLGVRHKNDELIGPASAVLAKWYASPDGRGLLETNVLHGRQYLCSLRIADLLMRSIFGESSSPVDDRDIIGNDDIVAHSFRWAATCCRSSWTWSAKLRAVRRVMR